MSCSFFSGQEALFEEREEVLLQLPVWPPQDGNQYPKLSRWLIHIEGSGGSEINDEETSRQFYTREDSITIKVAKNQPVAITASPLLLDESEENEDKKEVFFFKPAGIIYPSRKKYITWEGGFLAECMQRLLLSKKESGISDLHMQSFISSFNWKKAQEIIDKKLTKCLQEELINGTGESEEAAVNKISFYNPWLCDSGELLENLSFGVFSSEFLNNSECVGLAFEGVLSSFVLENAYISRKKTVLLKKNCPTLFYTDKDYAIILTADSAKNLSLSYSNLPIFIDKTLYEEKNNINNSMHFNTNLDFLLKKGKQDYF